jgi:hypothetical protein
MMRIARHARQNGMTALSPAVLANRAEDLRDNRVIGGKVRQR